MLACAVIAIPLSASAGLLYNPVVTVMGDGTNALSSAAAAVSIDLFSNSMAGQAAPLSFATYNNIGASFHALVDSGTATSDGSLSNNPSLSDAAAKGLSYAGPAYAYNAGYDGTVGTAGIVASAAPRVVGGVTLTATLVSNPTILATSIAAVYRQQHSVGG